MTRTECVHDKAIVLAMAMLRDARAEWLKLGATTRANELTRLRVLYRWLRAKNRGLSGHYRAPDRLYAVADDVAAMMSLDQTKVLRTKS
jgi:hypothetical protein